MKSQSGFTLIEAMIVVAVSGILLAITLPLSAFWLERADMSAAKGELSQGFGKAIALALRNEHALSSDQVASAMCISSDNELTILQPTNSTELPSCATGTGTATGTLVWTSSLPDDIEIKVNGNDVSCMCFRSTGFPTTAGCGGCTNTATVQVSVGSEEDTVHVR